MPQTKEQRKIWAEAQRIADPDWDHKRREKRRQYYRDHTRQFLNYRKEYRRRSEIIPLTTEQIAQRRKVQRKHYYAKRSKNKEYTRAHTVRCKEYRRKLKLRILEAYGPVCVCCGETIPEFLVPDHINGGGCQHLKRRGVQGIYLDIIREGFPKDKYQILCMNCNWGKSVYGACPHGDKHKA